MLVGHVPFHGSQQHLHGNAAATNPLLLLLLLLLLLFHVLQS